MTINWGTALPVWWSVLWRWIVYGAIGAIAFGFVGALIAGFIVPENAETYGLIGGYIATIPASMLAVKQALQKNHQMLLQISAKGEVIRD